MTDYSAISIEMADAVATLTLQRPKAGNSLGAASGKELRAAIAQVAADRSIRLLRIQAEGKAFCVGGDLAEFAGQADLGPAVRAMVLDYHAACASLAKLDIPVLCVVQGPVAGAGLALTSLADYVICASSATFTYAYTTVGLSADGGVTWLLPRLMGLRNFRLFATSGQSLSSAEALAQGLVSQVVADDELQHYAAERAAILANGATRALGAIRRLTLESYAQSYQGHLDRERDEIATLAGGEDAGTAIADVLHRRAPRFAGR